MEMLMSIIWRSEFPSAWWLIGMTLVSILLFFLVFRFDAFGSRWQAPVVHALGILGAVLGLCVVLLFFSAFGLFY